METLISIGTHPTLNSGSSAGLVLLFGTEAASHGALCQPEDTKILTELGNSLWTLHDPRAGSEAAAQGCVDGC